MAEFHPRLEAELGRQFAPVLAPDSLWQRIHEQRRPLRVCPQPWTMWSIATASALVLLAGLVWRLGAHNTHSDLEVLARQELRNVMSGTEKLDIQSADRLEIQAWLKDKLGVDLKLSEGAVELCGARIFRSDRFSGAVITYKAGNKSAAMIVASRSETTEARHTSFHSRSTGDAMLYSWSHGGGDFAIAFADTKQPHKPCLLCHAIPAMISLR